MVVGGVPDVIPDHAQRIANQGIDMVLKASEVRSPASGQPLQVSTPLLLGQFLSEKYVFSHRSHIGHI